MDKLVYIASPLSGVREMAEKLSIPVRQIGAEDILSVDFSPTKGMGMTMG